MMRTSKRRLSPAAIRFGVLCAFCLILALTGGTYRIDVPHLIVLRPAAALALLALLLDHRDWDWRAVRVPLLLLAAFAITMILQLIPLPPPLWVSLPGHAAFAEAAKAAGVAEPWRPISLTPDLTLYALVSLVPALAILVGYAGLSDRFRVATLGVFLGMGGLSAFLALVQIAGGSESPAYLYGFLSDNLPVGLLTNRNHQAALMSAMLPALACAAVSIDPAKRSAQTWSIGLLALGLLIVPMVLLTGSRFGLAGLAIALAGSGWIVLSSRQAQKRKIKAWPVVAGLGSAAALLVAASIWFGRATSIDRILGEGQPERRIESLPVLFEMLTANLPFGTGHGSFDAAFRIYEPDHLLYDSYFNHAHNDVLELLITGGLPAALVLLGFAVWFVRSAIRIIRSADAAPAIALGRLGLVTITILAAGSVVDYPLRTPLMGGLFALACAYLAAATVSRRDGGRAG